MAKYDRFKNFWKTTKSVSIREIAREAERPFAMAVVGLPEKRAEVFRRLFPGLDPDAVLPERSLLRTFDSTDPEAGFPVDTGSFDIVIDAGSGRISAPPGVPIYSVDDIGEIDTVLSRILEQRPDLALSLGKRFPGLRDEVARRIIKDTATVNAEFAMLTALPGIIPVLGAILPAGALGDIFVLTKNQAMMMYRLAALHELPLDTKSRSRDIAPLLANAFGWRALAREIVGAVPGGVGLVARGSIAYAGTVALGRGLEKLYSTGVQPTRSQISAFYKEAYGRSKATIQGIARKLTAKRPRQIAK
jgi:uncharacterized protein (DUF697 family)